VAEISFDGSDTHRGLSFYEDKSSSSSMNSSVDVSYGYDTPTRLPLSKHVSFDGSNVSDPVTPETNTSRRDVTSGGRIVSLSPILADDQFLMQSQNNNHSKKRTSTLRNSSCTSSSIGDESAVTVPTSNLVERQVMKSSSSSNIQSPNTDETSISSSVSFDEFGVARNAYESSVEASTNPFDSTDTIDKETIAPSSSTNPFDTTGTATSAAPKLSVASTNPFETDSAESTNPFDSTNEEKASISERIEKSSFRPVTVTPEQESTASEATSSSRKSAIIVTEPTKKASWMTFLRPLNDNSDADVSKIEHEDDENGLSKNDGASTVPTVSVWNPSKPFEMVDMYQDPKEIIPVLFMVESKRQCWFHNEMEAIRREWQYYKKLIRENVQEIIRVEDMIQSSNNGFLKYVQNIDDMVLDMYVNEVGDLMTKRDKAKLLKKRSETNDTEDDHHSTNDATSWVSPMIESFSKVQGEIKTQMPFLQECLVDVTNLKQDMIQRGKELEEKGTRLSLRVMEQAEGNIQGAFDALMKVVDDLERSKTKSSVKSASSLTYGSGTTVGSDGVLREFLDETKTDEPSPINDRWLYESQYRYAAKLGLLSWKENRKDYEFWYAEVVALHEERKCRLNEVLQTFLPRRKDLLAGTHMALMSGSDALDETKLPQGKEARAIDKAIERNAVQALKSDPMKNPDLTIDAILNPKSKSNSSIPTKYARSSTDLWKSALVRERRLVELKVNKEEWKVSICMVTLDDCMNIFILADDIVNESSSNGNNSSSRAIASMTTNPFESSNDTAVSAKPLDYYTKQMSCSVTTKIPPVEYSIKLLDYDITIEGGTEDGTTAKSKNPFGSVDQRPTEIEFVRRARSMIFRKREDYITLRVPTRKDAIKFLRNRLPPAERMTEI
jgi:hypothetical protein